MQKVPKVPHPFNGADGAVGLGVLLAVVTTLSQAPENKMLSQSAAVTRNEDVLLEMRRKTVMCSMHTKGAASEC